MSTTPKTAAAAPKTAASRHQQPPLKCPRCDSPNTKFCYFNNYSLSQPRHFCKTCRRYWTHGGALRTVPIGGGCRKNKKIRSPPPLSGDSSGGLKFFQGVTPAMDFNQLNFNFTTPVTAAMFDFPVNPEMGFRSSLVSSIESLSSINQDLHWKMQKQRLAMLLPGDARKNSNPGEPSYRKPPQIMDDNLEFVSSRKDGGGGDANLSTEWFFDNCYATPATSYAGAAENSSGWSSGVQGWSDLSQFSSVP